MQRLTRTLVALSLLGALVIYGAQSASGASTRAQRSTRLVSAQRCAQNRAAGTMTFVSPFSYDASAGIIDIFAAKALGYFSSLCVNVAITVPSFSLSPYVLVSSGRGTVTGEGSAADDLLEVANHANLTAIATYANVSNYALLTRPSITNLRQLKGKTLGYHTVVPVVLQEMLARAGVKMSSLHTVNDYTYNPALLVRGKFDALQAYQSNEPLELAAMGYKANKDFREYVPKAYGVQGTFNVQIVNGTFLAHHESTVADFLRAELKATAYCIAHQARCVSIEEQAASAAHVSVGHSHDLAEWRYEASLIKQHGLAGRGIGVQTTAEWRPEAEALVRFHLLAHMPNLSASVENTSLVASLYHGTKLIWP